MGLAIPARENDLVLGTHGRSVFVIDDYSALRNIDESDFSTPLKILSVTNGQHYVANQTPSSRFTGSGEFRAENEPYGVAVTFIASGDDLPHPDKDTERARKIRLRANATAKDEDENGDGNGEDKGPKITITVTDTSGEKIRTFRRPVHQGINRIVWDMHRDGLRAMPGPEPQDYEDGVPSGIEVPPADYAVTLTLNRDEENVDVVTASATTVADPRSSYPLAEVVSNYKTLLEIQAMQEQAIVAVEKIVRARSDIATVKVLIEKRDDAKDNDDLKALTKSAGETTKALDDLEKLFRVPPETRGIVYRADKIANQIDRAQGYVGSSYGAPSAAAHSYINNARTALDEGLVAVNEFFSADLAKFRAAVEAAGIGLLSSAGP